MDDKLRQALRLCPDAAFEEAVGQELRPLIASDKASRAGRLLELEQWIAADPAREHGVRERLRIASPASLPDLDGWLAHNLRFARDIPIIGFSRAEGMVMEHSEVFTPLSLSAVDRARGELGAFSGRQSAAEVLAEVQVLRRDNPKVAGLAVVGLPGAGKTTLLKHLYVQAAEGVAPGLPAGLRPVFLRFGRPRSTRYHLTFGFGAMDLPPPPRGSH